MSNQVVVIHFCDSVVDYVYLDSEENAIKRLLSNNLGQFLNTESSTEEISFFNECLKLMKENKWQEAFELFNETIVDYVVDFENEVHFYPISSPTDLGEVLKWIKTATFE